MIHPKGKRLVFVTPLDGDRYGFMYKDKKTGDISWKIVSVLEYEVYKVMKIKEIVNDKKTVD